MTSNIKVTAFFLAVLATLFWAGNAIVGKLLSNDIPAFTLNFWRWVMAFTLLLPFSLKYFIRQRQWFKQNLGLVSLLAILSITLYNAFQYLALHTTSPGNVGILTATMPMFILIISRIMYRIEVNGFDVFGILLAFMGIIYLVISGGSELNQLNTGDLIMLLAVFSFAMYSILLRKVAAEIIPAALLLVLIGLGIIFSLPLYIWDLSQNPIPVWANSKVISLMTYVAIFPALGSYFLWNAAVKKGGAMVSGLSINMLPVFALILSAIILDSAITIAQILAMVLVFTGTVISIWSHAKR